MILPHLHDMLTPGWQLPGPHQLHSTHITSSLHSERTVDADGIRLSRHHCMQESDAIAMVLPCLQLGTAAPRAVRVQCAGQHNSHTGWETEGPPQ